MQTRSCRVGIHGRNRSTFEEWDYRLIQEMRAETVRMMTWPLLDYTLERIFLRKVGGNYIFIHRLLQKHFAELGTEQ